VHQLCVVLAEAAAADGDLRGVEEESAESLADAVQRLADAVCEEAELAGTGGGGTSERLDRTRSSRRRAAGGWQDTGTAGDDGRTTGVTALLFVEHAQDELDHPDGERPARDAWRHREAG
jgi:hypothetical protein